MICAQYPFSTNSASTLLLALGWKSQMSSATILASALMGSASVMDPAVTPEYWEATVAPAALISGLAPESSMAATFLVANHDPVAGENDGQQVTL